MVQSESAILMTHIECAFLIGPFHFLRGKMKRIAKKNATEDMMQGNPLNAQHGPLEGFYSKKLSILGIFIIKSYFKD